MRKINSSFFCFNFCLKVFVFMIYYNKIGDSMKKIIYFILSALGIVYIFSLSACVIVPNIASKGVFGQILHYLSIYGGAGIIFLFASVNFSGNIFKIILNILLILVTVLYIVITIIPEKFAGLLGF